MKNDINENKALSQTRVMGSAFLDEKDLFKLIFFDARNQIPIKEMYEYLNETIFDEFAIVENETSWFINWTFKDDKDDRTDYDVIYKNRILSSISAKGYLFLKKYNVKFSDE